MKEIIALELNLDIGRDSQREYDQFLQRQKELRLEIDRIRLANTKLRAEIKRVGQDERKSITERQRLTRELTGQLVQNENALRNLTREQRSLNRAFDSLGTATEQYDRINREARELQTRIRAIRASGGVVDRRDIERLRQLNAQLDAANKDLGTFRDRSQSAFGGLKQVLVGGLIGIAIREITQQIFRSIEVFGDFEEQIAFLGAISGATGEELRALEADARRLGETTFFTASQVAGLQTEFARFGFSTTEILQSTEATLNAALASGEGVSEVAKVVAQSIRAYGLETTEAERVTDVFVATLNSSGARLDSFAEASKFLAPTAKILGVSFEEASAAIGLLADNGLEGTIATRTLTTALQRLADEENKAREAAEAYGVEIFNTNGEFVGLAQTIENVNEATRGFTEEQRLAAISQIFGQEASKNFALLLTAQKEVVTETGREVKVGAEALRGYTEQLEASNGEAARAAELIGDTLNGDIKILQSTIEALRINFIDLFDGGIRFAVQGITSLIQGLNELISIPVSEQLRQQQQEFNTLTKAIINNSENESVRLELIKQLKQEFPEYIKDIDLENEGLKELNKTIELTNENFERQIGIRQDLDKLDELDNDREKILERLADANIRLAKEENEVNKRRIEATIGGFTFELNRLDEERTEILKRQKIAVEDLARAEAFSQSQQAGIPLDFVGPVLPESITDSTNNIDNAASELDETAGNAIKTIGERRKELEEELKSLNAQLSATDFTDTSAISSITNDIKEVQKELDKLDFLSGARKATKEEEKVIKGSIGELEKRISDLQAKLKQTPDVNIFRGIQEDIEAVQFELEQLNRNFGIDIPVRLSPSAEGTDNIADFLLSEIEPLLDILDQAGLANENPLLFNQLSLNAEQEGAERLKAINDALLEDNAESYEKYLQDRQEALQRSILEEFDIQVAGEERLGLARANRALQVASDTLNIASTFSDARTDREIADVNRRYDAEIDAAQGNQARIIELEEERDARIEQIEREAFERSKTLSTIQAVVNGALAITATLAAIPGPLDILSLGTARLLQIGFVLAETAAQVATIQSQEFEFGGVVDASEGGKAEGRKHSQGGMKGRVRGTNKTFEFEGEEGIIKATSMRSQDVIRAEGTPAQIASAINQHGGGVKFADNPRLFEVLNSSGFKPVHAARPSRVPARPIFQDGGDLRNLSGENSAVFAIDYDRLGEAVARQLQGVNLSVDVETFKKRERTFDNLTNNSF